MQMRIVVVEPISGVLKLHRGSMGIREEPTILTNSLGDLEGGAVVEEAARVTPVSKGLAAAAVPPPAVTVGSLSPRLRARLC